MKGRAAAGAALFASIPVFLGIAYVRYALLVEINHDEVEHLHVAFRTLLGELPYRDFYQNHWPLYWLLARWSATAFPFSVTAVLALRLVNLLLLVVAGLLGLRLLRWIPGGATPTARAGYATALLVTAHQMDFHLARPDALMALLATAALCVLPAQRWLGVRDGLLSGLLLGVALSVSTKALPFVLALPLAAVAERLRDQRPRGRLGLLELWRPIAAHGVGIGLGLAPTLLWLLGHGLAGPFWLDVVELNRSTSKPTLSALGIHNLFFLLPALLGSALWLGREWRQSGGAGRAAVVTGSALACAAPLALLIRHSGLYNYQLLLVPLAVGFAALLGALQRAVTDVWYRVAVAAALLGYPVTEVGSDLVQLHAKDGIGPASLQRIVDLARPGGRTCVAFSPAHPIFCRSVTGLSNDWDLYFARRVRGERQRRRFQRLWSSGIDAVVRERPDIVLRQAPLDHWNDAARRGLVTETQLEALEALRPLYEVHEIDDHVLWLRRPGVSSVPDRSRPAAR